VALRVAISSLSNSVSADALPRALRIIEALRAEAALRGHAFLAQPDGQPGFRITIGEDSFDFAFREERDKADTYSEERIAAAKYPWQRVSPKPTTVPSGRLAIEMTDGYETRRWADRARSSLTDKLPAVFALIEDRAQQARNQRDAAVQAVARRREQWEQALPKARARYIAELNRTRAIDQAAAWRIAGDIRAYVTALRREGVPDEHSRQAILAWAKFAEEHANRIDPLNHRDELCFVEPDQISSDDLDRHMPVGMTVRHPPDETARSWSSR
jgi:hypothetical protein